MGKWAKSGLSDLEMTFQIIKSNSSIESWSISSPRSCKHTIVKVIRLFSGKLPKCFTKPNVDLFQTFQTLKKWQLERLNQIHALTVHQYPPWEASCQIRETVINFFWINCLQVKIEPHLTFMTIQPNPYVYCTLVPSWEIKLLSEMLMTNDEDDGQLGIRKAPLPFGWRS